MIPVTQTKVVVRNSNGDIVVHGNCWAACIASILEVEINQVPNVEVFFDRNDGFWSHVMDKFLGGKGYEIITDSRYNYYHKLKNDFSQEAVKARQELNDTFYMGYGMSPRGVLHSCIYKNGQLVHDPHPSKDGTEPPTDFQVIEKITK